MKSRPTGLWRTHRRAVLAAAGMAAALTIAGAFIWPITDLIAAHDVGHIAGPQHATQLQTAREVVRTQLLTLAAGVFVAGALWFTAQNYRLSRQGQVTDRYTRAIEQLGSDKLDVRIGAIYALERIARDSVTDHPTVMEVLAAFIREHSREQWPPSSNEGPKTQPAHTTRPDVQAAVTVIGRRDARRDRQRIDLTRANLAHAKLTGANLAGAYLGHAKLARASFSSADLAQTELNDADLTEADLIGTNFTGADLTGADLAGADLSGALFMEADLYGARLTGAIITGAYVIRDSTTTIAEAADFTGAALTRADLTGVDLTGVGLAGTDLTGARLADAAWPKEMPLPEGWVRDPSSGKLKHATSEDNDSGN